MNIGKSTYVGAANTFAAASPPSSHHSKSRPNYDSPPRSYKLPAYHYSPPASPQHSTTSSEASYASSSISQKQAKAYATPVVKEDNSWTMINFWPEPNVIWLFGALLFIVTCTNFYWLSVCHDIPSNNETEMTLDVALQQLAYHEKTRESEDVIEVLR